MSRRHQPCGRRAINIEKLSPPRSPGRHSNRQTSPDGYETPKAISMSDVIAAAESGKFNLEDLTSTDSTPFYRLCISESHKTSRCPQMKNNASFIRTSNRNFSYSRTGQTEATSEQPRQQQRYQQSCSRCNGWSSYCWNLSLN